VKNCHEFLGLNVDGSPVFLGKIVILLFIGLRALFLSFMVSQRAEFSIILLIFA